MAATAALLLVDPCRLLQLISSCLESVKALPGLGCRGEKLRKGFFGYYPSHLLRRYLAATGTAVLPPWFRRRKPCRRIPFSAVGARWPPKGRLAACNVAWLRCGFIQLGIGLAQRSYWNRTSCVTRFHRYRAPLNGSMRDAQSLIGARDVAAATP